MRSVPPALAGGKLGRAEGGVFGPPAHADGTDFTTRRYKHSLSGKPHGQLVMIGIDLLPG